MISKVQDGEKISDIELKIPSYQRPYKWTAKNVLQLLDDIIEAKNENKEVYRVGTLILHSIDNGPKESKAEYHIVDGQQRTISFSLLLKALGEDSIRFLEQPITVNERNKENIPNNFRALTRRIKSIALKKERDELHDYIKTQCELIVVITDDLSEAFQFFDSQNARGKKLYPHDLLKAYHLREMRDLDATETEAVVKSWEDLHQKKLSTLFSEYLYRMKEWIRGKKAWELTEHNIHLFKGITRDDSFPFAQFYKGAFAYSDGINKSSMPFVSGMRNLRPFQLDTPIIAGKPFFDYAKHYFNILQDIQNNDKYEGYFIHDDPIIKTLDLRTNKNGVGNQITRLLFDTALLLYVDRFCPDRPAKADHELLNRFLVLAFVWAYSLRAQYMSLGWKSAQNYIIGSEEKNSFNLYQFISQADSPASLLSALSDRIRPLQKDKIKAKLEGVEEKDKDGTYKHYLYHFKTNGLYLD